jgi:hypothetical protein
MFRLVDPRIPLSNKVIRGASRETDFKKTLAKTIEAIGNSTRGQITKAMASTMTKVIDIHGRHKSLKLRRSC